MTMRKVSYCHNDAYLISAEFKSKVINDLYDSIPIRQFRYKILNEEDKNLLERNTHLLQKNTYTIGYNTLGSKKYIFFTKYEGKNYCFDIDTKKLSYSKQKVDVNQVKIHVLNFRVSDTFYNKTIFWGDMIRTKNSKWFFNICDVLFLKGKNFLKEKLTKKFDILNKSFNKDYKSDSNFEPCPLIINKLYNYGNLNSIVCNKISTENYNISGLVFYPVYSGTRLIYQFNEEDIEKYIKKNNPLKFKKKDQIEYDISKSNSPITTDKKSKNVNKVFFNSKIKIDHPEGIVLLLNF